MLFALFACTQARLVDKSTEQTSRFRVTNMCSQPIWMANQNVPTAAQNVKIDFGLSYDYSIPNGGKAATRFWPKMGCDAMGNNCLIGESGGPGQTCTNCAPAVDSKFEATWGCLSPPCSNNPSSPGGTALLTDEDDWNTSQVDGYTLPYRIDIKKNIHCDISQPIDCSALKLSSCPKGEILDSRPMDLTIKSPQSSTVVGCYSPCSKLTTRQWDNTPGVAPSHSLAEPYCCPTIGPQRCMIGPVIQTEYVRAIHSMCPNVYAYAYDELTGNALHRCKAGSMYELTFFCPQ